MINKRELFTNLYFLYITKKIKEEYDVITNKMTDLILHVILNEYSVHPGGWDNMMMEEIFC
jgi:hypothetical protein